MQGLLDLFKQLFFPILLNAILTSPAILSGLDCFSEKKYIKGIIFFAFHIMGLMLALKYAGVI